MKYLLYVSLQLFATLAVSQEIKQLCIRPEAVPVDTSQVGMLYNRAVSYHNKDSARVFAYGRRALQLAQAQGDRHMLGRIYDLLGVEQYRFDAPRSRLYFRRAREQFAYLLAQDSTRQTIRWWVRSNVNYGASLNELGLSDKRIKLYMKLTPWAENIRDPRLSVFISTNLGISFYNLGLYEKAHQYFAASEPIYRRIDVFRCQVAGRLAFSACLLALDSLNRMNSTLHQVEDSLTQVFSSLKDQGMLYMLWGKYYTARQDFETALAQYDRTLRFMRENSLLFYVKDVYRGYGDAHAALGNYARAEAYYYRTIEESARHDDKKNQLLALRALAQLAERKSQHRQMSEYLTRYVALSDSVDLSAIKTRVNQLETEHRTEHQEREILSLEKRNYQAVLALERERFQGHLSLIASSSALILLMLGGGIIYHRKQHKVEKLAQERNIRIQQLEHQQRTRMLSALIEGQEKERQRLASDLHDGLAGRLSGITFTLARFANDDRPPKTDDIRRVLAHMNSSLNELRCIARNLTPQTLSEQGLKVALEDYCSSLDGSHSRIVLQCYDTEDPPDASVNLTLYRIVQELIHNAVKYARASEILVQYIREGPRIEITVEDDGVGFDPVHLSSGSQMGLANIRTRVDYLNGTLEIQSAPGEGTTVWIEVVVSADASFLSGTTPYGKRTGQNASPV